MGGQAALSAFGTACMAFSLRLFLPFPQDTENRIRLIASLFACFFYDAVAEEDGGGCFAILSCPKNWTKRNLDKVVLEYPPMGSSSAVDRE
jgi:hypothetical protein